MVQLYKIYVSKIDPPPIVQFLEKTCKKPLTEGFQSMGNCCQGLSNKIRTVLRINVPTGDASQTNSNDGAKQRQPILNETPPMFGEDSSSSETASLRIELNEPTFYHISPSVSRPLSEMTEEEHSVTVRCLPP